MKLRRNRRSLRVNRRQRSRRPTTAHHGRKRQTMKHRRMHGRGRYSHWIEPLQAAIQRIFPGHKVHISEFQLSNHINNEYDDEDGSLDVSIECNGVIKSILLNVVPEQIYIHRLSLCPPDLRGTDVLRGIISLAEELSIPEIRLRDESTVYFPSSEYGRSACGVSLATLKILTSPDHLSWYQSFGFVSVFDLGFQEHNRLLAESPFMENVFPRFVSKIERHAIYTAERALLQSYAIQNMNQTKRAQMQQQVKDAKERNWMQVLSNDIETLFPGITGMSVEDAFRFMVNDRDTWTSCQDRKTRLFIELCRTAEELIKYTRDLVYYVDLPNSS